VTEKDISRPVNGGANKVAAGTAPRTVPQKCPWIPVPEKRLITEVQVGHKKNLGAECRSGITPEMVSDNGGIFRLARCVR